MVRKILLILIFTALICFLTSCQTVQGIGGDIKWTGEKTGEIIEGL